MSNQDKMHTQLNIFNGQSNALECKEPTTDWDGLIYTFCYHCNDHIVNGFIPEYCIESWGKDNTVMLMNLFKDYKYSIQCRPYDYQA
jgi:hypothetical protein